MHARAKLIRRFDVLLPLSLQLLQLAVERLIIAFLMFLHQLQDVIKRLNFITNVFFEVVQHYSKRNNVIDVLLLGLIVLLHVQEQIVFCSQSVVALYVIYNLLESVLADQVILDPVGCWLPLKVIQTVEVVISSLPTWKRRISFGIRFGFHPPAFLQDSLDKVVVISWSYYKLERCTFVLLESILRNLGVLGQSFLPGLNKLFLLICRVFERIGQFLWRKVPGFLDFLRQWLPFAIIFKLVFLFDIFGSLLCFFFLGCVLSRVLGRHWQRRGTLHVGFYRFWLSSIDRFCDVADPKTLPGLQLRLHPLIIVTLSVLHHVSRHKW
jgi:hypothetical protein